MPVTFHIKIHEDLILFFIHNSWGRWDEVLVHASLRKGFQANNIEEAFRMVLLYCVNQYKGDDKIKSFIWDLITPPEFGSKMSKNHSGLSGPIPRGRRGHKKKKEDSGIPEGIEWVSEEKYDMESFLDKGYRKHLDRHNNKILLRVRMLYYIQHEILGEVQELINNPNTKFS